MGITSYTTEVSQQQQVYFFIVNIIIYLGLVCCI